MIADWNIFSRLEFYIGFYFYYCKEEAGYLKEEEAYSWEEFSY